MRKVRIAAEVPDRRASGRAVLSGAPPGALDRGAGRASAADSRLRPRTPWTLDSVPRYRVYSRGVRTQEVADQAGVNPQTLRYYERRGLLPEPPRQESGYRIYGDDAVRIVRFVKRTQELGFSLDEVESLLGLAGGGPENCDMARQLAQRRIAELERRIADLRVMRDSLERLAATCGLPRAERECPLLQSIEAVTPRRTL